jgi:hypothetical protein
LNLKRAFILAVPVVVIPFNHAQWDRFPLPWLKLFSEGLELALKAKIYTDKHEINLTLESLRRNRNRQGKLRRNT